MAASALAARLWLSILKPLIFFQTLDIGDKDGGAAYLYFDWHWRVKTSVVNGAGMNRLHPFMGMFCHYFDE
jgi:hypothetical protein